MRRAAEIVAGGRLSGRARIARGIGRRRAGAMVLLDDVRGCRPSMLFGLLLIVTAIQLFRHRDEDPSIEDNAIVGFARRRWPFADAYEGGRLFTREGAVRTRMSRQALNYLLGQLETLGYLQRRDASGDQRLRQIYLTARGHEAMATIREVVAQVEAEWEQQLGPQNFSNLRQLLTTLNAITVDTAGERSTGA